MIIGFANCRISYDEEGFVTKNFLGIKRKFTYGQVTAINEDSRESYIYMGKRKVMVDELAIGGDEFIKVIKNKYRALHKGQNLPAYKKHDIFHGNVKDAGGFWFAYIMISVIATGLLVFSVCYTFFMPSTANNTTEHSVCFVSCIVVCSIIVGRNPRKFSKRFVRLFFKEGYIKY